MKNIFKVLFVSILGVILVACGGPKNDYKLEGKYSMKKVEYLKGTEIFKSNTNIEIIKKGDKYTIIGKEIEMSKDYERDYITKEIKFGNWEEKINNNFNFTGKIIKELNDDSSDQVLKSNKLYIWELSDEKGNIINIMLYKDSKVKEAIKNVKAQINKLKGAIYTGKDTNDVITLSSNNDLIIKYNVTAIKDN